MKTQEYKIVRATLPSAIKQLTDEGYRLQTALELQGDRCKDSQESLQNPNDWFYVAEGSVFYRDQKNGALSWAHTDAEHNLVIQPQYLERALKIREGIFREISYDDILEMNNFQPDNARESWDAINHENTKRFALSDLELVRGPRRSEYFVIPIITNKYDALSSIQQKAANLFGFNPKNVDYLNQKGIKEIKLAFPNPEFVDGFLNKNQDPFWRNSMVLPFNLGSTLITGEPYFLDTFARGILCYRGVRSINEDNQTISQTPSTKKIITIDDTLL